MTWHRCESCLVVTALLFALLFPGKFTQKILKYVKYIQVKMLKFLENFYYFLKLLLFLLLFCYSVNIVPKGCNCNEDFAVLSLLQAHGVI